MHLPIRPVPSSQAREKLAKLYRKLHIGGTDPQDSSLLAVYRKASRQHGQESCKV